MLPVLAAAPVLIAGRYGLVRQLATGGMAEVWLARQRGLEGFEKLVVVKRILPHLANNPEFVQMFLDEARTAADLRHTNVASVTDVGTEAGAYFIAMEYLHGQDVAHIVQRCKVRGERFPLQHAMRVVSDAAQGLDYAHRKVDRHGAAQLIVHRDVSPQNILVTYEGATKLLDFGIASASHRSTHTDAGVVKGKYAYMSPEQFDGAPLDARSDLFSLGVVLWELVTLQRLFWRPSDAETLRAVMECKVSRPSKLQPECPEELEALILQTLEKDPARRLASCGAFAEAIDTLLEKMRIPHSAMRVGGWLRGMFPEHTLDPTETPVTPPLAPEAATRNEKIGREPYVGSKTWRVSSRGEVRVGLNLVPPATVFYGRPSELDQLATYFDEGARLVTVTGPAGQGKSRLASRFVELQPARWNGKVWTVDLSGARDADQLIQAVAVACGLEVAVCETQAQLVAETGRLLHELGPALLILDGFELPTAAIEQWLGAAPQLSLLVTRLEPLALPDECVLPLSGLDARGSSSEAVRMFTAQVEATVDPVRVAEICRLVRGLPMAIELVGARAGALSLDVIREQLADRASLNDVIAWTWTMLSPTERQTLSQLSVFRGGFTIEAADWILTLDGTEEVSTLLTALLRKSLLRAYVPVEAPGRLRFRIPASIHAYAAAQLEASGQAASTWGNHAEWFLQQGDEWPDVERLAQASAERQNLLAIIERAQAGPATAASDARVLRALHGLDPFFSRMLPYGVHLAMLDQAIAAATTSDVEKGSLARALQERANIQRPHGDPQGALTGLTQARELARATHDRELEARILCDIALTSFINGDVDAALSGLESSLEIARAGGDAALEVRALSLQGVVFLARRDLSQALVCCDKALPLARSRGDAASEARVLGTVGSLFMEERRTELARAFFSDAVARCEDSNDPALKGYFLGKLAQALAESGAIGEARVKLNEAMRLLRQAGDLRNEGLFLSVLAGLESSCHQRERAWVALEAAQVKLERAKDPALLTVLALRTMQLSLTDGEASPSEARLLLREVATGTKGARARTAQSEEVRLAALQLERLLLSDRDVSGPRRSTG